ncbi:MAG: DUF5691 domain-containing protein [Trueperaceae bacterium]
MNLQQLANTALLGTQRATLPTSSTNDAVKGLLEQLSNTSLEHKLLSLAGTLSLYEEAGATPPRLKRVVNDLPLQDLPRCSVEVAKLITRMLEGQHGGLLFECLRGLAKAKQRVPEEMLPFLFDRARNVYQLRAPLLAVIGETGRWLARQNPQWYFADVLTFESANADWKTNVMLARQGILKQVRTHDATLGLELINNTWKNESPTDRIWILKTLHIHLSLEDEPFLETALDDRSFTVRKASAELLSTLPSSRLEKRMVSVAEAMFELRDEELFVEFPDITPQLTRDGVGRPMWNDTEKVLASQLNDTVGLLPLEFWSKKFNTTPETMIKAAKASIWSKAFMGGFASAIERQANSTWALALLMVEGYTPQTMKVLTVLSLDHMEYYVNCLLEEKKDYPLWTDNVLLKILSRWLQPWSEAMSEMWLQRLHIHKEQAGEKLPDITLESTLKIFTRHCPPSFVHRAKEELKQLSQHEVFKKICIEPISILEFREKILKVIQG